jgi:hypothetical protein
MPSSAAGSHRGMSACALKAAPVPTFCSANATLMVTASRASGVIFALAGNAYWTPAFPWHCSRWVAYFIPQMLWVHTQEALSCSAESAFLGFFGVYTNVPCGGFSCLGMVGSSWGNQRESGIICCFSKIVWLFTQSVPSILPIMEGKQMAFEVREASWWRKERMKWSTPFFL